MRFILLITLIIVSVVCDTQERSPRVIGSSAPITSNDLIEDSLINNELVVSFVVFRHGDRTPDQAELDLYPAWQIDDKVFFPYGKKAITIEGRQRAFLLGQYLRERYNESISELYLPEEISVRTTDYSRTKMSALVMLAALYMPQDRQRWHPDINWQPVPYNTLPLEDDDLLYFDHCTWYNHLKYKVYEIPPIRNIIDSYRDMFKILSVETGRNITTPEEVFFLDNLFQAMAFSTVTIPKWAEEIMPQIKNMTKIDYYVQYYNRELTRLSSGVLLTDIVNITKAAIAGKEVPKLHLYSAHEHNVAALLAGLRVFVPHQPKYGSAAFLELRRNRVTGKYGVMVMYAPETGGPGLVLPIEDCGGEPICDYDKFISLTQDLLLSRQEYKKLCSTHVMS
ncbi:venom acid phosphatase Acph-1-like [Pararge aegeria]|uniref:acid phosphatase n=1 Tax=Pararge aegeria aegeria TaxID=348720 RepID=A0A8S4SE10_9NEOP|nr:venom acid phosphatase Acph-1-like [Pararge aegeria]CAH2265213.1 jg19769 [Pararge aegeria aegeria]